MNWRSAGWFLVVSILALLTLSADPLLAVERAGKWTIGGAWSWALISPDQINDQIQLDNLTWGTRVDDIGNYQGFLGELRYGLSRRVALEAQAGYLWQENSDGRVSRRISAKPITASVVYFLFPWKVRSLSIMAGGGILLDATFSGSDPLGGSKSKSSGWIGQFGVEFEQFLGEQWAARFRALGQIAKADAITRSGGEMDLSGGAIQLGLRIYFR